jgi:hypothetical protein
MAKVDDFLDSATVGDLQHVQKMLADGDALITDADEYGNTALLCAAYGRPRSFGTPYHGGARSLPALQWLLEEGGARITDRDKKGNTALLLAAYCDNFKACWWLLEHGGADIAEANDGKITIWHLLTTPLNQLYAVDEEVADITALLRVMVVRCAPRRANFGSPSQVGRPEHSRVVEEGARLRAALPAYLVRRRALLDAYCPLIPPLLALVREYDPEPTTTEELWATGLGVAPQRARRPRPDVGVALPVNRSACLRQRLE